ALLLIGRDQVIKIHAPFQNVRRRHERLLYESWDIGHIEAHPVPDLVMSKSGLRSSVFLRFVLSRKKWRPGTTVCNLPVRQHNFHVALALQRNVPERGFS